MSDEARNSCRGFCCEAFALGGESRFATAADVVQMFKDQPQSADPEVKDMLVPLGRFNRNPIHVVDGENGPVVEIVMPTEEELRYDRDAYKRVFGGHFFTCKHFKKESRDCGIYEKRPHMCRSFPNEGPCPFAGCSYTKPWKMVRGYLYDSSVQFSPRMSQATQVLLADALGVPKWAARDDIYGRLVYVSKELT